MYLGVISGQEHECDQPDEFRWPLNGRAESVIRRFLESKNELVGIDELGDYRPNKSRC